MFYIRGNVFVVGVCAGQCGIIWMRLSVVPGYLIGIMP